MQNSFFFHPHENYVCIVLYLVNFFFSFYCQTFQQYEGLSNLFQNDFIVAQVKLICGRGNRLDALAHGNRPATAMKEVLMDRVQRQWVAN